MFGPELGLSNLKVFSFDLDETTVHIIDAGRVNSE